YFLFLAGRRHRGFPRDWSSGVCSSDSRCETGMPATPPPPAGIRTRGGCSYSGLGLLRYVSCRSTAPGAKRVCRQLRRRLAFAPGACAPTVGSGFSDIFCVGAPPPGAPTVGSGFSEMFRVGAPPSVRNGLPATQPPPAGIRTRGGCSYSGFGLLRYLLCRSTALGAKRVCRQLSRRRLAFGPGAGAPTVGSGFSDMLCVGAPPPVRNGAAGSSAPLLCGRASARPYQARSAGALQEVTWFAAPRATCAHASCAYHWP